jgi:pimeloyl-ACP methyl ester carboxylesterase
MPFAGVNGEKVHYAARPGGRSGLLFIHGGFGSSTELWERAMHAMPAAYRGYAVDNFIRSDAPEGGYNIPSFARRAARLISTLEIAPAVLVGHSMGGVVCQYTALTYPECVAGLVLVATGATMKHHGIGRQLLEQMKREGMNRENIIAVSKHWFHREPPRGFFEGYIERALQAPLAGIIEAQASLLDTDLVARLGEIRAPTLIVHGREDHGRKLEHARTLNQGIPGSELVVIDDCGHSPMLEAPVAFDRVFHAFLAKVFR